MPEDELFWYCAECRGFMGAADGLAARHAGETGHQVELIGTLPESFFWPRT